MRLLTSDHRITENAVIDWVDCSNGQVVNPPPPRCYLLDLEVPMGE